MAQEKGLTNTQVVTAAREGREGHNGRDSFSTFPVDNFRSRYGYTAPHIGWMPDSWERILKERYGAGKVTQVLVSFYTTIAWEDVDYGWIMPDVRYSPITGQHHQGKARGGWAWRGLDAREPAMPDDATIDDARRVLSGELIFTSKGYGINRVFTGTVPGPNYQGA